MLKELIILRFRLSIDLLRSKSLVAAMFGADSSSLDAFPTKAVSAWKKSFLMIITVVIRQVAKLTEIFHVVYKIFVSKNKLQNFKDVRVFLNFRGGSH